MGRGFNETPNLRFKSFRFPLVVGNWVTLIKISQHSCNRFTQLPQKFSLLNVVFWSNKQPPGLLEVGVGYSITVQRYRSSSTRLQYHHHVVLVARISLTLSRHFSLSFIASGRSSGQHPVSSHSCWMYVRAGRPVFARPCVGVHKSTSLISPFPLLQQCTACLVRLTWIVFVIGGRWLYSWCLVGCYRQDLFKIARSILV